MKHVFILHEGIVPEDPMVFETAEEAQLEANKIAHEDLQWVHHEGNPNKWSDFSGRFTVHKVALFKRGSKR